MDFPRNIRRPGHACAGHPKPTPAAYLEILGHAALGPVRVRRDVCRANRGGRLFCLAAARTDRCCRCDPCARRWSHDFNLRDHGSARRSRSFMDCDPSVAHTVRRLSGAALDLVDQCSDRRRRPVRGWSWGGIWCRGSTGREVTPGFMGEVLELARADGALWLLVIAFCVAAPITEEFFARGFLYRGWSETALRPGGAILLSSLVWTALHLQYDWFFLRRSVLDRPVARLSPLSQPFDLADGGSCTASIIWARWCRR